MQLFRGAVLVLILTYVLVGVSRLGEIRDLLRDEFKPFLKEDYPTFDLNKFEWTGKSKKIAKKMGEELDELNRIIYPIPKPLKMDYLLKEFEASKKSSKVVPTVQRKATKKGAK